MRRKKASALRRFGWLSCEVCEFDFAEEYGSLGEGFIECHHTQPLSAVKPNAKTALKDLALVCANCHRMLHTGQADMTIQQLKKIVAAVPPKAPILGETV